MICASAFPCSSVWHLLICGGRCKALRSSTWNVVNTFCKVKVYTKSESSYVGFDFALVNLVIAITGHFRASFVRSACPDFRLTNKSVVSFAFAFISWANMLEVSTDRCKEYCYLTYHNTNCIGQFRCYKEDLFSTERW